MKIKCLTCKHGYTPVYSYGSGEEVQSCDFGLKDGAAPVGDICPMTGRKLQNIKEKDEK